MIHPATEIRFISEGKGYGLIAKEKIPKGTITFVQDQLDVVIEPGDPRISNGALEASIERYSYLDAAGRRIISWDAGKYMNHCCHANTLTCGYGFELAIRDIEAGEEITDDYRIFTIHHPMMMECNGKPCPYEQNEAELLASWDMKTSSALKLATAVPQALWACLDQETIDNLETAIARSEGFPSVALQMPSAMGGVLLHNENTAKRLQLA